MSEIPFCLAIIGLVRDQRSWVLSRLPRRQRLCFGKPTFRQGRHSLGLQMAQRHNFRGRRARKLCRELLCPIGTVERETTAAGVDYPCGDHVWRDVGFVMGRSLTSNWEQHLRESLRGCFLRPNRIDFVSRTESLS